MLRGFFDHFPDLSCDIPTYDDIPQSLPLEFSFTDVLKGHYEEDKDTQKQSCPDVLQEADQNARMETLPYGMTPAMPLGHLTNSETADEFDFWQLAGLVNGDSQGFTQIY